VAQKKKRSQIVIVFIIFVIYFLVAAKPIPLETILAQKWISSLTNSDVYDNDPENPSSVNISGQLLPFTLGSHFGYVDTLGQFAINRIKTNDIYLSRNMWTEYSINPANIVINNILDDTEIVVANTRGYPILLNNRIFILGSDQNSLSEVDNRGNVMWTYEFGAPITCIDAAADLVLTGSIDGVIEVFNYYGERIFYFEPGGSRYSVILGCTISSDGSYIGIICGVDTQRFLLFERFGSAGGEYKVVYHEFLETGFRRPVYISFIDDDSRIVFERAGGIGCYSIKSRRGINIPLDGNITAIDDSGGQGFFFVITSHPEQEKRLIGIRFPHDRLFGLSRTNARDSIFIRASFKSDDVFFGRTGSMLVAGGGSTLISFDLEEN
jgi:hypothetical protein